MGGTWSSKPRPVQILIVNGGSSNGSGGSTSNSQSDLISYQKSCAVDPTLRTFDADLQTRVTRLVSSSLSSDPDLLSFASFSQFTSLLLDLNDQVVHVIVDSQRDVWKSPELLDLVKSYFDSTTRTLDFCRNLEICLSKARDSLVLTQLAVKFFHEGDHRRTLEELQRFKDAETPFGEAFFNSLQAVLVRQESFLEELRRKKGKLDKKLESVRSWRRVSNVLFVSAVVAILVCSVAAAAMAAPPVAAALAAAASVPLGSMGKWINSIWKGYEKALEAQKELINGMRLQSVVVRTDLDEIRVIVERVEEQIQALGANAEFAFRGDDAVRFAVEEIERKSEEFAKCVDELGTQAHRCIQDTRKARAVVLQGVQARSNGNRSAGMSSDM